MFLVGMYKNLLMICSHSCNVQQITRLSPPLHGQGTSLILTGVIVHGFGIYLYIADEGMAGGANWSIEIVPWF